MFRKLILIFFLFLFCGSRAFADTFVVTSNADSGPGTLREALTLAAANGSAVKDYINFNLPDLSVAGRTIIISSQLPNVSSNLVIDGSTQPGTKFGMSDAKICIKANRVAFIQLINPNVSALYISQKNNVEVYGLETSEFYYLNYAGSGISAGISIIDSQNIRIGAPGKGNWIHDCDHFIFGPSSDSPSNSNNADIRIQSNYFGFEPVPLSYVPQGISLNAKNVTFGGTTLIEGNHIATATQLSGSNFKISNNYIGIDGNGDNSKYYLPVIEFSEADNVEVSYNTSQILRISLNHVTNFKILANKDIAFTYPQSAGYSINMVNCSDGIIGSEDETLENVFFTNTGSYNMDFYGSTIANESSNNIQILKNKIICSGRVYSVYFESNNIVIPKIQVLVNNSAEYSGTASPNSNIYIYYDDSDCPVCSPLKFFTKITADINGQWKITGNFNNKRFVSNALLLKNSSEFTQPSFSYFDDYFNITQPTCSLNNGSIEIINTKYKHILRFEWYNSNNEKIGEGPLLKNAGPGRYYAIGFNGECFAKTVDVFLYNIQPSIVDTYVNHKNPSCGIGGSITGLIAITGSQNTATYAWRNQNNTLMGNKVDISGLPAGKYILTMTDDVIHCSTTYGPVILTNTSGSNIDESTKAIQSTPCGQLIGSITNITVTGTNLKYSWKNEQGQEVATTKDLIGKPAGKYTLQVTDDTPCGPVYSSQIEIPETNGITLNIPSNPKTDASCNKANGSITGIIAPGATKFEWRDANNNLVGNNPDLKNVPAGAYRLTASNDFGCSKTSQVYQILELPGTTYSTYTITRKNTCFGETNGSISVTADAKVKSLRWVNGLNQTISGNQQISDLAAGTYKLYFTDQNDCESLYNSYTINEIPQLQIIPNTEQKTDDECDLKTGSIKNIQITGGLQPYVYEWYNANNEQVSTGVSPTGLSAGNYKLIVNDASGCAEAIASYSITAHSGIIAAPSANDVQLCTSGNALLTVNSAVAGYTYRLYESVNSITPLAQQANGRFTINAKTSTAFYISQVSGGCESSRTKVQVTISLSAIHIANAFTPNGDGINDYWKIEGIENYPNAQIQIFNRYGQKLFESKGYPVPFNGTSKGNLLANGAYYYIINLNKNCSLLSGYLSIIR
ncbi:gliding motility-associated C-terminal domain-containing protein [Mucilaginibacter pocheonensis]|uniref:Gliding motility-associated-like protein n=1 Tax=Mucilaginibacter pocheonensis TaxID=398050 RepID=A0ABU1TC02_9SPHI|nr:gliding motility-associated C-terminal domain-containing protein [Mucilaginibacter pocheonensis]MDR6942375.1 gliding motility-associated-like protein [Mucilaginibacter pocheonensis]